MLMPWIFELYKTELDGLWNSNGVKIDNLEKFHTSVMSHDKEVDTSPINYVDTGDKKRGVVLSRRSGSVRVLLYPEPDKLRAAFCEILEVFTGLHGEHIHSLIFGDEPVWAIGKYFRKLILYLCLFIDFSPLLTYIRNGKSRNS